MQNTTTYYITHLQKPALELQNAFIKRFKQTWGLRESVCELVIQIGHLIHTLSTDNVLLADALQQQARKPINNIADELSDCLLSLLSISFYTPISESDIENTFSLKNFNISNLNDVTLALSVLGPQLLDSYEIYSGLKPGFKRDERKIFISLWAKIFTIILELADFKNIDLEKQFNHMLESAYLFLSTPSSQQ